jgi:hypothetical protein
MPQHVPRRSRRLMVFAAPVLSLWLVVSSPAVGDAVPSFTDTLASGSVGLEARFVFGGGSVNATTANHDTIGLIVASNFAAPGLTGMGITWSQIDSSLIGVTHAGQSVGSCGSSPGFGPLPCAYLDGFDLSLTVLPSLTVQAIAEGPIPFPVGPARLLVPPPGPGDPLTITVPGTFSLWQFGVVLWDRSPGGALEQIGVISSPRIEGPASLTFRWWAPGDEWLFYDGGGGFSGTPEPTPEPTTLLLWGTGAAGLGLVRWRTRRSRCAP